MYFRDSTASADTTVSPAQGTSERFAYLDVLRGGLLVIMAINHVPSDLHAVTDHFLGYMSAAEGFVFLAGLMAGLVYTRLLLRSGAKALRQASLKRAGTIYAYHLGAYLFLFLWVVGCRLVADFTPPALPVQILNHPMSALLAGPALIYQPSLFDVLPMYFCFVLLIPILLGVLERGHRKSLFAVSLGAWALANIFLPQSPLITASINSGAFNIASWQLLFVTGVIFGHAWTRGLRLLPAAQPAVVALAALVAGWLFLVRHAYLPSGLPASELGWLVNKNNLAPLRLLDVAILFWLAHLILRRHPKLLAWRPLEFLGRHSIFVFTAHVGIAYVIYTFPAKFAQDAGGRFAGTLLMLGGLFAAAGIHHSFHQRRALDKIRANAGGETAGTAASKRPGVRVGATHRSGEQTGIGPGLVVLG